MGTPAVNSDSACVSNINTHSSTFVVASVSGLREEKCQRCVPNGRGSVCYCECAEPSPSESEGRSGATRCAGYREQVGGPVAGVPTSPLPREPHLNIHTHTASSDLQTLIQQTFLSVYNKQTCDFNCDGESASDNGDISDSCISIDESNDEDDNNAISCGVNINNHIKQVNTTNNFTSIIFRPFSNIFRRIYPSPLSILDKSVSMGNLQGSEGKRMGGGKSPAKAKKEKSSGTKKSPARELLKQTKGQAPVPATAVQVKQQQQGARPGVTAAPAGGSRLWSAGGNGSTSSTTTYVVTDSWRHVKKLAIQTPSTTATAGSSTAGDSSLLLTPPSRESSSESVFTDPLTPQGFAEAHNQSLGSSYYSDTGSTLPRDNAKHGHDTPTGSDSTVRPAPHDGMVGLTGAGANRSDGSKMGKPQQQNETSDDLSGDISSADPDDITLTLVDSHEQLTDVEDSDLGPEPAPGQLTQTRPQSHSLDALDEESPLDYKSLSAQPPSSFTLVRHRKVELTPTRLSDGLLSGTSQTEGQPPVLSQQEARDLRRHSSVSDVPLDSNVLRKVASLTLDRNTLEQRVHKPRFVPEKLDFQIYEKFEGQMLINWFVSAFTEDHYLRLLLTSQDLRILAAQFCTHLLAAGVLRQIPDKDVILEALFRPDLMYYWSHAEIPMAAPPTPGRLSSMAWPPPSPVGLPLDGIASTLTRPGARYTEAEFQQVVMGLKREHRDNLTRLSRQQEVSLFTMRGEQAQRLCESEERVALLEETIENLRQELERNKTIADIQSLTEKTKADFGSPTTEKKVEFPAELPKSDADKVAIVDVSSSELPKKKTDTNKKVEVLKLEEYCKEVPVTCDKSTDTSDLPQVVLKTDAETQVKSILPVTSSLPVPLSCGAPELEVQTAPSESSALNEHEKISSLASYAGPPPPPPPPLPSELSIAPPLPPPMSGMGPPPPPMPDMGPPPPPMPDMGPPPPPMPGMGPPPPPMPGMGPPPPPVPGMGPPPPPMPGMGPPPPPMPGMGPPPPPMPGMGPPPPPMPGMGPPPPPMPGMGPPPPPPAPGMGPPPPPPGLESGPMPFPAPPVGGWMANRAMLRKQPLNPTIPMKPLYWTRIIVPVVAPPEAVAEPTTSNVVESSNTNLPLWEKLEEASIEDISEFATLFSRQVVERKPTKKKEEKPSKQQAVKILDGKRSQNVGILASSLHVDFSEIENAIYNFDTSVVNIEALQQIYEVRASTEELEMIRGHMSSKPDVPLDKPEQFLYELAEIPNFAERIACFMFQAEFEDGISSIESKLNNIKSTCQFLMTSESLKTVLAIILALGNYMNGGNHTRGQADGFHLEILGRLRDVKSNDSSVTLLHFIVRTFMKQKCEDPLSPDVALPVPEPGDIERSAAVNFEELGNELQKLQRDLAARERKAAEVIAASTEENLQPFKGKMETFLGMAKKQLSGEMENLEECKQKFKGTMDFYQYQPKGMKDDEVTPKDFFALWSPFCSDFKDIWKKEQQRIIKEKAQEAKRKREQKKDVKKSRKSEGGLKSRLQMRAQMSKND